MAYRNGTAARNAACDAVAALYNNGTGQVRTGGQPATVATAASGTLLGTFTFGATAFGAASNGTATANSITGDSSADASGLAGHVRFVASGGSNAIADADAGEGTGTVNFDNANVIEGGTLSVSSMSLTQPI